jgi:hypothetical protein
METAGVKPTFRRACKLCRQRANATTAHNQPHFGRGSWTRAVQSAISKSDPAVNDSETDALNINGLHFSGPGIKVVQ